VGRRHPHKRLSSVDAPLARPRSTLSSRHDGYSSSHPSRLHPASSRRPCPTICGGSPLSGGFRSRMRCCRRAAGAAPRPRSTSRTPPALLTVPRRSLLPDLPPARFRRGARPRLPPRGSGSISNQARRARSSSLRSTVTASSACATATMRSRRSGSKPWSSSSPNAIGNRHSLPLPTTRSSGYASPLPTWQSATG
jgi:hypothetical protein